MRVCRECGLGPWQAHWRACPVCRRFGGTVERTPAPEATRPTPHAEPESLFSGAFPTRPEVQVADQLYAPLEGTNQGRYEAWRRTGTGERVYAEVRRRALLMAARGERRVGTKALCEDLRKEWRVTINNTFTALIARELIDEHPHLLGIVELRERRAA